MRTMKLLSLLVIFAVGLFFSSCQIEEYGCTDPRAINFNIDATVDDGSCYYGDDPGDGYCIPDEQGNLVISNHTGEQLLLYRDYVEESYGDDAFITCIPADTNDFLVNIPNSDLSVCLLQIWKASDVLNTSSPDLDIVYRQWRVALSNSTEPAERANWLITGQDNVTGTGTLFLTYPDMDEYDHEVLYQVDILLNSKNGAKLASLQPGVENKMVSVDYGVHYLYFHYWYSNPNSSTGNVTDIGWLEHPDVVINESHKEASIDIQVYSSIVGKYGELTVVNENDFVVNVSANGELIENIAIVDGSTQGLSSIPANSQTTYMIPVNKYTISVADLSGKEVGTHTGVQVLQEENLFLYTGVTMKSIKIINNTSEILGLFNLQEEFLGLKINPLSVSGSYSIPASYDSLLVINFSRTKSYGFNYSSTVSVSSLEDYVLDRLDINKPWPFTGDFYESPVIEHANDTSMQAILINSEPVSLSFEYNVSSEPEYDKFSFMLDGSEIENASGESGWVSVQIYVDPGSHSLEWNYSKDQTRSEGRDNVQIRNISTE